MRLVLAALAASGSAVAQSQDTELETVTVTATRVPAQAFEVPASVYRVGSDELYGTATLRLAPLWRLVAASTWLEAELREG